MAHSQTLHITDLDRVDGHEILVQFSDGTAATFTTADLAGLKPDRSRLEDDRKVPNDSGAGVDSTYR